MTAFDTSTNLLLLLAALSFVGGLHLLRSPRTARRGNLLSAAGMALAVVVALGRSAHTGGARPAAVVALLAGLVLGGGGGAVLARRVGLTAMPELVSLFNAAGGAAAALIAFGDSLDGPSLRLVPVRTTLTAGVDVLLGTLTLAGSLVAAGKLHGLLPGRPVAARAAHTAAPVLAVLSAVLVLLHVLGRGGTGLLVALAVVGLALGVVATMAIGGADMPVVISLLNACTGTAVAMAGFVLDSTPLVIAGALVGAAGSVLTVLMAKAMNRTVLAVVAGGFGTAGSGAPSGAASAVRTVEVEDAALQLAYASRVVVVPGYGLAAAQAQHELVALVTALASHGVEVTYAVHPVAGRMPGHMNVLLAEADAPYSQMRDLDEANAAFPSTDVVLVVGANDVTNPAAHRPGNAVSGMPVLDVDRARSVLVVKRSLGHGYAGIDNELYAEPGTGMLFGDAKAVLGALLASVRSLVG